MLESDYKREPAEIYRESFSIIRAEADLSRFPADVEPAVVRMIHACGQVDLASDVAFSPNVVTKAREALNGGAPILCDAEMVASGITRKRLPAENEVICHINSPLVQGMSLQLRTTRSAGALEMWRDKLDGAVVAIGNAPTALFRLMDMLLTGAPRPAAIIGIPVGFVGAEESKKALEAFGDIEFLTVHGRRGGSAIVCAAINAIAQERE